MENTEEKVRDYIEYVKKSNICVSRILDEEEGSRKKQFLKKEWPRISPN